MAKSFWKSFLASIESTYEKNPIFYSILKDLTPVSDTEDSIIFNCRSVGAKNYLQTKKADIEEQLLVFAGRKITVSFEILEKPPSYDAPLLSFEPSQEDKYRQAGLHGAATFENFAVSSSNQVAFAAAQAVSKSPGASYNPLFLYGGVGVGKTHLAQSVARHLLDRDPDNKVFFCSGEKFMNDLIESIRNKNTPAFRKRYRNLDLIIVDDIQFIAGKQTVQEEFFHTFNSIVSAGGQVILTSDRPPHEIRNLEDRLRSRFSGGLIVDIQNPDFELRTAILLIKATEKNIAIDIEAATAIAETILDTRSLEGMLLSLYARTLGVKDRIDLLVVEDFFKQKTTTAKKRFTAQDVIKCVCSYYDIKAAHIKSATRKSSVAHARQVIMYLLRSELDINLGEIAYMVKRKDHTTVIHAINKITKETMKDKEFAEEIDVIRKTIHAST